MTARTHQSQWRSLAAGAPLIGVALLIAAWVQGEHDMLRSHPVQESLFAVALLGALVAAWTAWRLSASPIVPVAQAHPGRVSLQGRAEPLPDAAPLLSPDGVPCLWFRHSDVVVRSYDSSDSVRPFLLVDASGSCIVLPAGADITGSSRPVEAKGTKLTDPTDITGHGARRLGTGERVLCAGDQLHVHGWFTPASAEALELQARAGALNQQVERPHITIRSDNEADFAKALAALPVELPPVAPPAAPQALPVVAGHGSEPFVISIGSREGQGGLYRFLAVADLLVACAAAALYLFVAPPPL
jgi:hypothetical protein